MCLHEKVMNFEPKGIFLITSSYPPEPQSDTVYHKVKIYKIPQNVWCVCVVLWVALWDTVRCCRTQRDERAPGPGLGVWPRRLWNILMKPKLSVGSFQQDIFDRFCCPAQTGTNAWSNAQCVTWIMTNRYAWHLPVITIKLVYIMRECAIK